VAKPIVSRPPVVFASTRCSRNSASIGKNDPGGTVSEISRSVLGGDRPRADPAAQRSVSRNDFSRFHNETSSWRMTRLLNLPAAVKKSWRLDGRTLGSYEEARRPNKRAASDPPAHHFDAIEPVGIVKVHEKSSGGAARASEGRPPAPVLTAQSRPLLLPPAREYAGTIPPFDPVCARSAPRTSAAGKFMQGTGKTFASRDP